MDDQICYLSSLPKDLREEIAGRIYFLSLSALEITSKFWRDEIRRMNIWKKIFERFANTESNLKKSTYPINYLWFINLRHELTSPVLRSNGNQLTTIDNDAIHSIKVPYKYYLQAVTHYKPYMKRDLEAIENRIDRDLTEAQAALAVRIYWYLHLTELHLSPLLLHSSWSSDIILQPPEEIAHLARKRPLQDSYTSNDYGYTEQYFLAVWAEDPPNVTLAYGFHYIVKYGINRIKNIIETGSVEEVCSKFSLMDAHDEASGSPGPYNHFIWYKDGKNDYQNHVIYRRMAKRYQDILEACAANVIESVKMSNFGAKNVDLFKAIKHYCNNWYQNISRPKRQTVVKASIVRAFRRVTRYLIRDEISQYSVWDEFPEKKLQRDYNISTTQNNSRKDTPAEEIEQKYWPCHLIEKCCFIAEPLSKILIELLESTVRLSINEDHIQVQKKKLQQLEVDLTRVDQVINAFKSIGHYIDK